MIKGWDEEGTILNEEINMENLQNLQYDSYEEYCIKWGEYLKTELVSNNKLSINAVNKRKRFNIKLTSSIIEELDKTLPLYICKSSQIEKFNIIFYVDSMTRSKIIRVVMYLGKGDDIETIVSYWKKALNHSNTTLVPSIRLVNEPDVDNSSTHIYLIEYGVAMIVNDKDIISTLIIKDSEHLNKTSVLKYLNVDYFSDRVIQNKKEEIEKLKRRD